MNKITTALTILLAACIAVPVSLHAQDPYDDLYYSPSKSKQKKQQKKAVTAKELAQEESADYTTVAPAVAQTAIKPLVVDVDAYNRRNTTPLATDSAAETEDFRFTRRIEKYHNPDVVVKSGDNELIEIYYNSPSAQDINVYVVKNSRPSGIFVSPFYNPFYYPYYSPYRYYSYWGPRWSFSWGFDPWFDISWGWADPWYYPAFGPSWGWGWTVPVHPPHGVVPPRPVGGWASHSPGASRPHLPAMGVGTSGHRPSASAGIGSSLNRPGNNGRPSTGWSNAGRRPSDYRPSTTGSSSDKGSGYTPSTTRGQGRYGSYGSSSSSSGRNSSTGRTNSSSSSSSSSSNRGNGSYGSGSSHSSYSSGAGRSSYSSGGYRSSGGGGGHGGGGGRGRR